jgi:tetratricopeptide (TPR) repeat protein
MINPRLIRAAVVLLLLAFPGVGAAQQTSMTKARDLLAAGSRDEALRLLRETVAAEPNNAEAHLLLGTVLAIGGILSESIQHLREAVRLQPDSAVAHNTLGMALSRFGEIPGARAEFERAVQLDPRMAQAHLNLALTQGQAGEPDAAAESLERAINLLGETPAAAYPRYLRAQIRIEQQQTEQAIEELERAVALRPDFAEAWLALGSAKGSLLDNDGAVEALEKAVALRPDDPDALYQLGSAYLRLGRSAEAIEHLREAVRHRPDDRSALYNLMRALRADGQVEQAEQARKRMAEVLADRNKADEGSLQAVALNNEGVELQKAGDLRGALAKYSAALELNPSHFGFRLNYGLALSGLGRWNEAILEFREVLRLDPGNTGATKALYIALDRAGESDSPKQ